MMFALWIAVTFLRPSRARVLEREPRDPRRRLLGDDLQALDDAGDDLVLEAGVEVLGVLADDDQVDVLRSGSSTPGRFLTGRRFAYRSSALRRPTLTLVKPSPIGVVTGPLSATLFRLIESRSAAGSDWPYRLNAMTPASWRSHSIDEPRRGRGSARPPR